MKPLNIFTILIVVLSLALFVACEKDDNPSSSSPSDEYITFSKSYYSDNNRIEMTSAGIVETENNGFILASNTWEYGQNIYLIKVDSTGELLWENWFGGENRFDWCQFLYNTGDGGTVFGGLANIMHPELDAEIFIAKLDSSGNEIWRRNFSGGFSLYDYALIEPTIDGGFIISVKEQSADNTPMIIKTDASGNELWSQTYDFESISGLRASQDGGFSAIFQVNGNSDIQEYSLVKLDQFGDINSEQRLNDLDNHTINDFFALYDDTYEIFYDSNIMRVDENGGVVSLIQFSSDVGSRYCKTGDDSYIFGYDSPLSLSKFNYDGNLLWNCDFGLDLTGGAIAYQVSDGGFALLCIKLEFNGFGYDYVVHLIKTDPDGLVYEN